MGKISAIRAVISGGASGLGYATAEKIINSGGRVCILDTNAINGNAAVKAFGDHASFHIADVSSVSEVDSAVSQAMQDMGYVNVVVNCAGIAPSKRILSKNGLIPAEDFNQVIAINLSGTFNLCRAGINLMRNNDADEDGERGIIINTASIAAYDGQIGQAAYAASKGAIVSMTLPLAREFAVLGVRVVTIAPGLFHTPLYEQLPQAAVEALLASAPFPKRLGKASEFADLVMHIITNKMINGEVIRLDAGLRM